MPGGGTGEELHRRLQQQQQQRRLNLANRSQHQQQHHDRNGNISKKFPPRNERSQIDVDFMTSSSSSGTLGTGQQQLLDSTSASSGFLSSFESSANSQDSCNLEVCRPEKVINPKGNIFYERKDYNFINKLPIDKQNAYFIQLEDDSCTGNEDMRTFLLTQLTNNGVNQIHCISCYNLLKIYDHFPIIDGVLFFSPIAHLPDYFNGRLLICWNANCNAVNQYNNTSSVVQRSRQSKEDVNRLFHEPLIPPPGCSGPRQIQSNGVTNDFSHHHSSSPAGGGKRNNDRLIHQERYLNAICGDCLHWHGDINGASNNKSQQPSNNTIVCTFCRTPLSAKNIIFGSLYTFDILAAEPCCHQRLTCKKCLTFPLTREDIAKINNKTMSQQQSETITMTNTYNDKQCLNPFPYFSQYSNKFACSLCNWNDYHFVRPFYELFSKNSQMA